MKNSHETNQSTEVDLIWPRLVEEDQRDNFYMNHDQQPSTWSALFFKVLFEFFRTNKN
jgi:hypothetical protein